MSFTKWNTEHTPLAYTRKDCWDAAQAEMQERCAKVCDGFGDLGDKMRRETLGECAEAIRALGKERD